ncbi:TAF5-like RNA polymerase II p300/CBP-associated factor-associated factor 65 kDa subunit 5L [Neocloeon triangulifer]|uniref:TAF5-like RNA polymerase II p300/CBP-associated factor-associated factor 65 kDa subunit 5L n=1 Tax=Neocloeon triangulifer TaxID=2078957 RepID=UPI00286F63BC|nr:TAF5-like RNA polymerase II p300/CBP-associated factor-associated factor 65 kDa subunit 5L [Neocloeon triangulifer]
MSRAELEGVRQTVCTYLRRRNYTAVDDEVFEVCAEVSADEMVDRAELAARLSQGHVLAVNNAPPDLAAYDQQFSRLKNWIGKLSDDRAKVELGQLLPLILSHMYLDLVGAALGNRVNAYKFLKRHYTGSVSNSSLIDDLLALGTCADLLSRPSVEHFRSEKSEVRLSLETLHQLRAYLVSCESTQLLQVIAQWICLPDPMASGTTIEVDSDNEGESSNLIGASGPPDPPEEANASKDLASALRALKEAPVQPMPMQAFFIANSKTNPIACASLNNDASVLAAGLDNGLCEVWSLTPDTLATGHAHQRLIGHCGPLRAVVWYLDKAMLTASVDHTIRLWPNETLRCSAIYRGHNGVVHSLSICQRNLYFGSASDDLTLKLWSPEFCHPIRTYAGHLKAPTTLQFHQNGLYLASGARDSTIRLWNVSDGRTVRLLSGHEGAVRAVSFHPDGRTLASAGDDSQVRLWDVGEGRCRAQLSFGAGGASHLAWSKDGRCLAAASSSGLVKVWDLGLGEAVPVNSARLQTTALLHIRYRLNHSLHVVGAIP